MPSGIGSILAGRGGAATALTGLSGTWAAVAPDPLSTAGPLRGSEVGTDTAKEVTGVAFG
ncbi:hypothetical protein GCM10027598_37580 [Amycolatopsis oliviviridis]|uniref:Uncharacterized protein n=1 Tax=Amycolatopsis oliviviridis TaxID=1471590 RepID=A0ABQ3LDE3_9PSEU|nr:hypothetical protein GCM10017790_24250 [Amycolatopsis oliviviridis]